MDKEQAIQVYLMLRELHSRFAYAETKMNEEELIFYHAMLRLGTQHAKVMTQLLECQHYQNKKVLDKEGINGNTEL